MLCWYATTAGEGREEALSSGGLDLIVVPGLGFTKVLTLKICSHISRPLHPRIMALFSLLCAGGESAWPRKGIGFAALHIGLFDIYICFFQGYYDSYIAKCVQAGFRPKTVGEY